MWNQANECVDAIPPSARNKLHSVTNVEGGDEHAKKGESDRRSPPHEFFIVPL
jgi:hypothetical protein